MKTTISQCAKDLGIPAYSLHRYLKKMPGIKVTRLNKTVHLVDAEKVKRRLIAAGKLPVETQE